MRLTVSLLAVLFGVWLLWSGHWDPFLISIGLVSTILVVGIAHRMNVIDDEGVPLGLPLRALAYLPWLLLQIVKANISVSRRVLSPTLPIQPQVITVRGHQRGDLGRVLYANSITLTPGTVAIEMELDEITVHALSDAAAELLQTGEMDRRACRLEGQR